MKLENLILPFRSKNFNYYMSAELTFRTALWIVAIVFGILIKDIKGNAPFFVGLVGVAFNLPQLFVLPIAGVFADRFMRRTILIIVQTIAAFLYAIMVITLWFHVANIWFILFINLLVGTVLAFGSPALQAYIRNVVSDEKALTSSISVFSTSVRVTQFLGYALGGIFFAYFGGAACFMIAVILAIFGVFFLYLTRAESPQIISKESHSPFKSFLEGFKYGFSFLPIAIPCIIGLIVGLCAWPYIFEMPILNTYYFHGTSITLGILLGVGGIGGFVVGLLMALKGSVHHVTKIMICILAILGVAFVYLANCHSVLAAGFAIFTIDAALSILAICSRILLQFLVEDKTRGRIMSILQLCTFGMVAVGSFFVYGLLGQYLGLLLLLKSLGGIFIVASLGFYFIAPKMRKLAAPILIKQKQLPDTDDSYKLL